LIYYGEPYIYPNRTFTYLDIEEAHIRKCNYQHNQSVDHTTRSYFNLACHIADCGLMEVYF